MNILKKWHLADFSMKLFLQKPYFLNTHTTSHDQSSYVVYTIYIQMKVKGESS